IEMIACSEQRVESAQTLETARVRHLRHRETGVRQQMLREQQAMRLRELDRRHTQLELERSPQLATGDPELARQCVDALAIERARGNARRGGLRESRYRVDASEARRQLRTTAQTGPISSALRGGCIREEPAVPAERRARGADRPAVDARRRD